MLNRIVSAVSLCFLSLFGFSHSNFNIENSTLAFIELQSEMAVREMWRTGIPASITLAQAIVESSWGNGPLAVEGNNYFGIKCNNNWNGATIYQEDDDYENGKLIASCFRKYASVEESYVDHSNFLLEGARYANLFNLSNTDYKGWAKGLKAAGYATDRQYAEKLIEKIESYQLYQYDRIQQDFNVESGLTIQNSSSTTRTTVTSNYLEVPAAFELPDDYVPNYYGVNTEKTPVSGQREPMPAVSTEAQHAVAPERPVRYKNRQ